MFVALLLAGAGASPSSSRKQNTVDTFCVPAEEKKKKKKEI